MAGVDATAGSSQAMPVLIIDGLNTDVPSREQFERMRAGGITAFHTTLSAWDGFRGAINNVSTWCDVLNKHQEYLLQVTTTADIWKARSDARLGVIFGFQNLSPIEDDLHLIEVFYRLGIRISQLTYSVKNLLGDGCWERNDGGLSYFGISAVREMNELGMLVDLSHSGPRTTLDAIRESRSPCAFTHVGARALVDIPRNKSDEELRAVASNGGVVGICVVPRFISARRPAAIDDFLNHIEYVADLVGIDHVAVGTDRGEGQSLELRERKVTQRAFRPRIPKGMPEPEVKPGYYGRGSILFEPVDLDEFKSYPREFSSMGQFSDLAPILRQHGYSDEEVRKVLGGNWLRLFESVWR